MAHLDSTHILSYRLGGAPGYCLTDVRRFEDAEVRLTEGEASLRAYSMTAGPRSRDMAAQWLVRLYEQWGKADQAAVWKQRLGRP